MSGAAPDAPAAGRGAEAAIGHALDGLRSVRLRYVAPLLLGAIMLFDSWDSIAIAYVMPALIREWHLKPVAAGSMISAGYAGQFVGAILLGAMAERFGRMKVFAGAVIYMGLFAVACAFAPTYSALFALRLLQGVAIGGALPVAITYINELAPTQIRGRYFAIFQWICMSGYFAASASSSVIIPHYGWRPLFALGALPLILLPIALALLPESPRWLARHGRIADAETALRKLGDPTTFLIDDAAPPVAAHRAPRIPMTALFGGGYRARTLAIIGIWFLTSFTNFGLTTWVPSIYVTVFHIPIQTALRFSAIFGSLFLIVMPTIALVIDHVGRRPLGLGGTLVAAVALLTLGFLRPTDLFVLVPLVIAGQLSSSTAVLVTWPLTAESYPTHVRAVALGLCSSIARGASTLTPIAVGAILGGGYPVAMVFGLFGLCAAGAFLLWLFATRETTGLRLDNI